MIKQRSIAGLIAAASIIAGAMLALPSFAQNQTQSASPQYTEPGTSAPADTNNAANAKLQRNQTKPDTCAGLTGDAMTQCARAHPRQQQIQSQDRPIGKTPNN
jgi:hypothetical protein